MSGRVPSKTSLLIRILVGGYLLYTLFELVPKMFVSSGIEKIVFMCAVLVFSISGLCLVLLSLRSLITGKYEGGSLDPNADENKDE